MEEDIAGLDASAFDDPVARDDAREKLRVVKRYKTLYNSAKVRKKNDEQNYNAVALDYARRCFEYDKRVQERTKQANAQGRNERGIRGDNNGNIPRHDMGGSNGSCKRSNGLTGRAYVVGAEASGAKEHFDKLYKEAESALRNQGAFSIAQNKESDILSKDIFVVSEGLLQDGSYAVSYTERIKPIGKRKGYMSHFFHEWIVYEKQNNADGSVHYKILSSGRTLNDAVRI